ncbi:MAG: dockerin type I repeat-containing protein [Clostridia bacterium]|nr:dockerin type I repeat-containing protein [Clostridia bacterium]
MIGDPYVNFCCVSAPTLPSADRYKYIALVYKMPTTNSQTRYGTEIFCQCEYRGAEPGQSVNIATKCTDKFECALYNAGNLSKWKGEITDLRIDFMSVPMAEGDVMYIHNIILAETKEEARQQAMIIRNELNNPPETEPEETEEATEEITEPDETTPEESTAEPETGKGDCNKDGYVDNKDVVVLFRYASSGKTAEGDALYDFNGDSEVNNKDVVELFRYVSAAKPQ